MTDNEIRAYHQQATGGLIGGAVYDHSVGLRERVIHMLMRDHSNTASLIQEADRIVKYIQTGDTAAPSKA